MGERFPCDAQHHCLMREWILARVRDNGARVVGVQGVQGSGKTHAAAVVVEALREAGLRADGASLDDFYSTRARMGATTVRGPPGTHDLPLLLEVLDAVRRGDATVRVPTYDKLRDGGVGDRGAWRVVEGPLDVFVLEGWCLGFVPRRDGTAADEQVARYHEALSPRLDGTIVLVAPWRRAYEWRRRAERLASAEGMSDAALVAFVDRYRPFYEAYLPSLQAETRADRLRLELHDDTDD